MKDNTVSELIEQFELAPHPEGGWFRELIRSELTVQRSDGHKRNAITGILFLLGESDKSRWHRVNGADEIWIHLQGAALTLWRLDPKNNELCELKLDSANPIQMTMQRCVPWEKMAGFSSGKQCVMHWPTWPLPEMWPF